jgi:hypothetical protein
MINKRNITFSKNDLLRKLADFSGNKIYKFAGNSTDTYPGNDLPKKIKEVFINNPNLTNMLGSGLIGGLLGGGLSWLSNLGEKNKKLKKSKLKRNLVYGTVLGLGLGTLYNLLSPGQSIFVKGKPSSTNKSSIDPLSIFGTSSSTEEIKGPSLIEKGLKNVIEDPTSVLSGSNIGGAVGTYLAVKNYLKNNPGIHLSKLNKPEHIINAFNTLVSGVDSSKLTEEQKALKTLLDKTENLNTLDNLKKQNIEIKLDNEILGFKKGDLPNEKALKRILLQDQDAILRLSTNKNTQQILNSLGLPETITISKTRMLPEQLVLEYLKGRGLSTEQASEAFSRLRYVPEGKGILSKFYISEPLSFSRFAKSYALPVAGLAFVGGLLHKLLFPNKET